jgi:hypothetical protein
MAKKKKSSAKAKAATRAQKAPVKAATVKPTQIEAMPVETAKKVAKPKVAKLVEPAVDATPQIPVARKAWRPTALERLALVLGGVLLIFGIIGLLQSPKPTHDTVSDDVKKQQIPMNLDDFKDDPAIQQAIQKQLGGNSGAAPTPQMQGNSGQSGGGASETLQSPASNVQAQ